MQERITVTLEADQFDHHKADFSDNQFEAAWWDFIRHTERNVGRTYEDACDAAQGDTNP